MLCGWAWVAQDNELSLTQKVTELKQFDLNSPNLPLDELGAHLRRNVSDVQGLDWTRFEDLTNDVFKANGFQTIQTARTKDGGADILLLASADDCIAGIVECKQYDRGRPIGVSTVRSLVGAAVYWDVREAYLVTSSSFTSYSKKSVEEFKERGYHLNLVDATEFLKRPNLAGPL
jgi:restriction system protein